MIIAIDGPSGAGKSTIGKLLAKRLGVLYLDTGAMYRAVAYGVLRAGIALDDSAQIIDFAENAVVNLETSAEGLRVLLNNEDISGKIRTGEIAQAASKISSISEVRQILVKRQQELGSRGGGCVLDGRDIGTVVFPNADVKIFLTATPEARAQRRFIEHQDEFPVMTFEDVLTDINERDHRDMTRADSPLKVAKDAVSIDTSELSADEVLHKMTEIIRRKTNNLD